ncbi:MAG: hypothetical protein QXI92_04625, partial [Candidatus Nitrosocaldus sp.]
KGRCYDVNFTTDTPGATSRAFSTYSANQNTLANLFDNLRYYWRDSSGNIGWLVVRSLINMLVKVNEATHQIILQIG